MSESTGVTNWGVALPALSKPCIHQLTRPNRPTNPFALGHASPAPTDGLKPAPQQNDGTPREKSAVIRERIIPLPIRPKRFGFDSMPTFGIRRGMMGGIECSGWSPDVEL